MKVNVFFEFQFGIMFQYGETYRKEKYICICLPFITIQIIATGAKNTLKIQAALKRESS